MQLNNTLHVIEHLDKLCAVNMAVNIAMPYQYCEDSFQVQHASDRYLRRGYYIYLRRIDSRSKLVEHSLSSPFYRYRIAGHAHSGLTSARTPLHGCMIASGVRPDIICYIHVAWTACTIRQLPQIE